MKRFILIGLLLGILGLKSQAGVITASQDLGSVRTYPNPWRSDQHATIPMTFDQLPDSAVSTLRIFTIAGEHVRTLSGTQSIPWDLRNDGGQRVASGVYLYLLSSNQLQKTGKIVVIR